jgi:hypothetical protein
MLIPDSTSCNVKKIYLLKHLTSHTETNEDGSQYEKKDVDAGTLPAKWNKADFNYNNNKDKKCGHIVVCGAISGICVLDYDTPEAYTIDAAICKKAGIDLCSYYTVKTGKGFHVYFKYDANLSPKGYKTPAGNKKIVDFQSDGAGVYGEGTPVRRANGSIFKYYYTGGDLLEMPDVIKNKIDKVDEKADELKKYTSNINYEYEMTEDELENMIQGIYEKMNEYLITYDLWLKFTTVMKTISGTTDSFARWCAINKYVCDEKGMKYNRNENVKIWNGIKLNISPNFFLKQLGLPIIKFSKEKEDFHAKIEDEYKTIMDKKFIELSSYNDDAPGVNNGSHSDFGDYDCMVWQSGTATGKTTCMANECASYKLNNYQYSILSIVNLISLADQQQLTFKRAGVHLTSYLDENATPSSIMAYDSVICINSLYKLEKCDFRSKIIYIDEVHSLMHSLTHNKKIKYQLRVYNTLMRALKTCHKVVVSDAHIFENVDYLLDDLINDDQKTFRAFENTYKKFGAHGTPGEKDEIKAVQAIKYTDENEFYLRMQDKIVRGECFSFASDSKDIVTKWHRQLKTFQELNECPEIPLLLYTSETDEELREDWSDVIIIYSPKFTTGVDITLINKTEQFLYITGKSVSSIGLYQMISRTRNMDSLHYYTKAPCRPAAYVNFEHCLKTINDEYDININFIDTLAGDVKDNIEARANEDRFKKLYAFNEYQNDYYKTNINKFFEDELKDAGFILSIQGQLEKVALDPVIKEQMDQAKQQALEDKFEAVLTMFKGEGDEEEEEEEEAPGEKIGVDAMIQRAKILNLNTIEEINKYKNYIIDEYVFNEVLNFGRLLKPYEFVCLKYAAVHNDQMVNGIQNNIWVKDMYINQLAIILGIKDNIFNFANIVNVDESIIKLKKTQKIIVDIKKLYRKRDSVAAKEYTSHDLIKLYKFMIISQLGRLGLFESERKRSMKDGKRSSTQEYIINTDIYEELKNLIKLKGEYVPGEVTMEENEGNEEEEEEEEEKPIKKTMMIKARNEEIKKILVYTDDDIDELINILM